MRLKSKARCGLNDGVSSLVEGGLFARRLLAAAIFCTRTRSAGAWSQEEIGSFLFQASARCPQLSSQLRREEDPECEDEYPRCEAFGDMLFDSNGLCKSPLDEHCQRTCALCADMAEYSSCRSVRSMATPLLTLGNAGAHVLHLHDLMTPGGPRRLFQRMAERVGQPLYSDRPLALVIDDFFSKSEADKLIQLTNRGVTPEDDLPQKVRNVSKFDCEEKSCQTDPTVLEMYRKAEQLVGLPAGNFESLEMLRYEPGQHYKIHPDSGPEEQLSTAGPRYLTFFGYMSSLDKNAGGSTIFPHAGIKIRPKAGRIVVWCNVQEEAPWKDERKAEHVAERVKQGRKYGFNLWIHPRNFRIPTVSGDARLCNAD
eukprot:TRINITY_DN13224_c0_g1_i2.p1 TRINITY_DN13224_c0_g1~~TRINITY_DN13224_c0_g1_i2.p1  ORF type:complete len:369 (-),score=53.15 TRINITY_DN13224_c0_g1_i2:50-1156(-)